MKKLSALAALLICGAVQAQEIHWLDTNAYQKPQPIPISKVNEATATNKWYVSLTSGSGSTCSQASPCSMDGVLGKAGVDCSSSCPTGPAVIYIKGTGSFSWFNDTVRGGGSSTDCRTQDCTQWVLIRPWPAGSTGCAVECLATISGNSNMNSSTVGRVIFDGGPNLNIKILSDGGSGTYGNNINSNNVLIYRTQGTCGTGSSGVWQVGATTTATNVMFVNNEFYACDNAGEQTSAAYVGPGATGGYSNFVFQDNIVRNMGGEGIEINPRVTSDDLLIDGNVFYHSGFVTCGAGFQCRAHIVVSIQSGSGNNGTIIRNNVMWDSASGCIWDRGGGTPAPQIYNNTCYDYGNGSGGGGPNPEGISGFGGAGSAVIRNNIIYDASVAAHNGTYSGETNNACASGTSCGSAKQTWTTSEWLSTTVNDINYLKIGTSSVAKDNGTTIGAGTRDFRRKNRPQGAAYDIGAFEYGSGGTSPPKTPTSPH